MDPISPNENSETASTNHDPILMSMLHDGRIPIRCFEASSTCRLQPDLSLGSSNEVAEPQSPSPPET